MSQENKQRIQCSPDDARPVPTDRAIQYSRASTQADVYNNNNNKTEEEEAGLSVSSPDLSNGPCLGLSPARHPISPFISLQLESHVQVRAALVAILG